MMNLRSFEQSLAKIFRAWRSARYDDALAQVERLTQVLPGNAQLHILWASVVQLQDRPAHSLREAKQALLRAVALDGESPAAAVELGHFLDAVDDDPQAAADTFAGAVQAARRLLIDGLLGQARALVQLNQRDASRKCLL